MRKLTSICVSLLMGIILCMSFLVSGCTSTTNDNTAVDYSKYKFNYDYFLGLCDPSGSLGGGIDKAITNEWLGDVAEVMGVQSFRLWVSLDALFEVDSQNNLTFINGYLSKVHDYVNELKDGGVKNFLFLCTCFVYPYGSTCYGYDVPDPENDSEEYLEFLKINAKAYGMLAKEFPEITNWESGNEPDLNGSGMHRHGYIGGASNSVNKNYIFSNQELAEIICDMSWYIRKEVKAVNEKNRVCLPALSLAYDPDGEFFESIYEAVESKTLPYGQEKSDIDPDNYFDVLDWHPYLNGGGLAGSYSFSDEDWNKWVETACMYKNIANKHGDAEKPAYFSEFGYTDYYNEDFQEDIANNYIIAFDLIRSKMPWVEAIFCFRATTLIHQKASNNKTEENFGLFYNMDDDVNGGKAKPAAKAIADYAEINLKYNFGEHFKNYEWLEQKYGN